MVSRKRLYHAVRPADEDRTQHQQLVLTTIRHSIWILLPIPNYYYIIYQYQKNNVVFCNAVKMNAAGERLSEPVVLDTT